MSLTRLQQLIEAAKYNVNEPVLEAKSPLSDFDGIRSVVEDSLADLCDKLCSGGALHSLMKETGADKLDTVKDKDGHTVMKKLDKLTSEYKKSVEKLLMEAETMVSQVAE